jgi:hypothetical protein
VTQTSCLEAVAVCYRQDSSLDQLEEKAEDYTQQVADHLLVFQEVFAYSMPGLVACHDDFQQDSLGEY